MSTISQILYIKNIPCPVIITAAEMDEAELLEFIVTYEMWDCEDYTSTPERIEITIGL